MSSPVQLGWTRQLEMAATNPFQEDAMAQGLQRMRLNPPPTRKWVTFQDWDEEALEYKESVRRHSGLDITNLSSSVSSDTGSLGSDGAGSGGHRRRFANLSSSSSPPPPGISSGEKTSQAIVFNSSFGGYTQNGEAATLRTMFQPPARTVAHLPSMSKSMVIPTVLPSSSSSWGSLSTTSASPLGTPPQASLSAASVTASSSAMSVPSPPPGSPDTISPLGSPTRYSAFNELIEQEKKTAELSYGDTYAALEALRQEEGGAYLGWSNQILGNSFGWSETIKGETRPAPPDTLPLGAPSHPNHLLPSSSELCPEVSVETQSTPEMTGLRTISWPRSPTRTFVRNFP